MPKPNLLRAPQEQVSPGTQGANRVRNLLRRQANDLDATLHQLNRVVSRVGRQAVEDALGPDADDLPRLYEALKAAAEIMGVENIPDLPDKE